MIDRLLLRRLYNLLPHNQPEYDPDKDPVIQNIKSVSTNVDRITEKLLIRRNDLATTLINVPIPIIEHPHRKRAPNG